MVMTRAASMYKTGMALLLFQHKEYNPLPYSAEQHTA